MGDFFLGLLVGAGIMTIAVRIMVLVMIKDIRPKEAKHKELREAVIKWQTMSYRIFGNKTWTERLNKALSKDNDKSRR